MACSRSWGWRVPFLASALLVIIGLYVRLQIEETPVFRETLDRQQRVRLPMAEVFRRHPRALVLGTAMALATFVLFYLTTVFSLTWGTTALAYARDDFLIIQLFAVLFFALTVPVAALLADRFGRRRTLLWVTFGIGLFGLLFQPLFGSGGVPGVLVFLVLGLALMGMTYGPLGTVLSELFPPEVRYTGASLTFNLAGIFGASLAPYIATSLATRYGLAAVGYYLAGAALITLAALWLTSETRDQQWLSQPREDA